MYRDVRPSPERAARHTRLVCDVLEVGFAVLQINPRPDIRGPAPAQSYALLCSAAIQLEGTRYGILRGAIQCPFIHLGLGRQGISSASRGLRGRPVDGRGGLSAESRTDIRIGTHPGARDIIWGAASVKNQIAAGLSPGIDKAGISLQFTVRILPAVAQGQPGIPPPPFPCSRSSGNASGACSRLSS